MPASHTGITSRIRLRELALAPVMPNPAIGPTTLAYTLPRANWVRLSVLDVTGRRVATLAQGRETAGTHQLRWQPRLSSGIYLVALETVGERRTRRMVIMR